MKRTSFLLILIWAWAGLHAQTIRTVYHNVQNGQPGSSVNRPGTILYPTGYTAYDDKTPVIFVHGFTGKLTGSYEAHIADVIRGGLHAAFVQLEPMGTPEENGMLLKRMIDQVAAHYGSTTVSIVAHSKGGMDTERALYGKNPYNPSIPSFGFEKVDGVYTFGSPLKGSRVADVGAALSWTGIAWIAMWYTNAFHLTSANVQEFHNWASSWRIQSNGSFRNYYNPRGASYSRINMIEDNTTRWWAHQSDDPCYGGRWYFCYVGNAFHHSAGAYYDAYWEWDWLNSGWRNWHTDNDGFIAVYRARREVITDASPALTPGAGDANYITTRDADHISLWDPGEGHFAVEVLPYLHRALYVNRTARPAGEPRTKEGGTDSPSTPENGAYLSDGYIYAFPGGEGRILAETAGPHVIWVYAPQPLTEITVAGSKGKERVLTPYKTRFDAVAGAYATYFKWEPAEAGYYHLQTGESAGAIAGVLNLAPRAGFAVQWNWDENKGYTGNPVDVIVSGMPETARVRVYAQLARISDNGRPMAFDEIKSFEIEGVRTDESAHKYQIRFPSLQSGAHYAVRVYAVADEGEHLLARNAINTFYVHEELPLKDVAVRPVPVRETGEQSLFYPNPVKEKLYIRPANGGQAQVLILTMDGRIVRRSTIEGEGALDVSGLKAGAYWLEIRRNGGKEMHTLLVE
ncbi:MAG: T9SS type A sorting domain-containing protein [Chlorobi bacterium]|nr:T9SS type A sorting domain-containing protein [Chlorobiota bacterium]